MASFTKNTLVSDIILRISRGKPSDDLELESGQVAFWIDQLLPALIKQSLDSAIASDQPIDPDYIKIEESVTPILKVNSDLAIQTNVYIDLCNPPISLLRDRGVIRVATDDGFYVDKVTFEELDDVTHLKFSKPSTKSLKYNRVKKRLYFYGVTEDTIGLFKFNIAYIPLQKLADLGEDDLVYVGNDILPLLAEAVEAIARRQMYQSDIDEENDGQQDLNVN